jgi:hypothetical protein
MRSGKHYVLSCENAQTAAALTIEPETCVQPNEFL